MEPWCETREGIRKVNMHKGERTAASDLDNKTPIMERGDRQKHCVHDKHGTGQYAGHCKSGHDPQPADASNKQPCKTAATLQLRARATRRHNLKNNTRGGPWEREPAPLPRTSPTTGETLYQSGRHTQRCTAPASVQESMMTADTLMRDAGGQVVSVPKDEHVHGKVRSTNSDHQTSPVHVGGSSDPRQWSQAQRRRTNTSPQGGEEQRAPSKPTSNRQQPS